VKHFTVTDATPRMALALEHRSYLGEGVLWHAGRWCWTDIEGSQLHDWAPGELAPRSHRLPDRLGCFAPTRSGRVLLGLAKQLSLATLSDEPGAAPLLQPLVAVDAAEPRTRVNDGRTDRQGNLVFGTLNEAPERRPIGSFYQYSLRHGLRRLALPAVAIANSICFSPDGGLMYFCDTLAHRIMVCDYDAETAQVANLRVFVEIADAHAWPDGSVVDREGCLWNAQWGAGQVLRYSPEGRELARLKLDAPHVSCPALGGGRGDVLCVTTARQDLDAEALAQWPLSGSLFSQVLDRPLALADTLFDDSLWPAATSAKTKRRRK
jgi:sugar lactone lactonase YvrE